MNTRELYSFQKLKLGIPLRKMLKMKQITIFKTINESGTHKADADEVPYKGAQVYKWSPSVHFEQ